MTASDGSTIGVRGQRASAQTTRSGLIASGLRPGGPWLLACDLDGTLLDPAKLLRPSVQRAVRAVRGAGAAVILATGRSPWTVTAIARELDLRGPQIMMSGGLYASPVSGEIVWARQMSPALVDEAMAFADRLGVRPLICCLDGHVLVSPIGADAVDDVPDFAVGPRLRVVPTSADVEVRNPIRVYVRTGPAHHRRALAAARAWFPPARASIVWSDEFGLEILAPGTNKGQALRRVARAMGIGRDGVAAIGDGPNDLEMLAFAGRSAAMAPGSEELRTAAGLVVPSSADDGAIEAMRRFFPGLDLADEPETSRRILGAAGDEPGPHQDESAA